MLCPQRCFPPLCARSPLPGTVSGVSELILDPLTGREVLVSPARRSVPRAGAISCPFCPGREDTTDVETARFGEPWTVRSFRNLYPILTPDAPGVSGEHEVVVTRDHDVAVADLAPEDLVALLTFLAERERSLRSRWPHVALFMNQGPLAGASQPHPHAQVLGIDRVPERIRQERERIELDCALCGPLEVVSEVPGFRLVAAPGPTISFELLLLPTEHEDLYADSSPERFAPLLADALSRLRRFGVTDLNLVWHSGVGHWHVHVLPRWAAMAGFELGTMTVVGARPSVVASTLRSL